jgi:hypothetical protein
MKNPIVHGKGTMSLLLTYTIYHNGLGGFPTWKNIYEKFLNEDFPLEDDNLGVYQNIRKSGLYVITTRPHHYAL